MNQVVITLFSKPNPDSKSITFVHTKPAHCHTRSVRRCETNEGMRCIKELVDPILRATRSFNVSFDVLMCAVACKFPVWNMMPTYLQVAPVPSWVQAARGKTLLRAHGGYFRNIIRQAKKKVVVLDLSFHSKFCRYFNIAHVSKRKRIVWCDARS